VIPMVRGCTVLVLGIAVASCANVGGGVEPAPTIEPLLGEREVASDWVQEQDLAIGHVTGTCPSRVPEASGCQGIDPLDKWTVTPGGDGEHCLELVWSPGVCAPQADSNDCRNLDLLLQNSRGEFLDASNDAGPDQEIVCADFEADAKYYVTVLAVDTRGQAQNYTLQATRTR
jgi:hypothetical protein